MDVELTAGWDRMLAKRMEFLNWLREKRENVIVWIAFRMPRDLAYWGVIRIWVDASHNNPTAPVPSMSIKDALDSWRKGR